jgi:hypothetical protein
VPVASFVDSTDGAVKMTAGGSSARQSAIARGAAFSIFQRRRARAVTDLNLKGGNFRQCRRSRARGGATAAGLSRRQIRRLRMRARGNFRTNGRYSSNTVRGTIFTVADRCDGTLTRVQRGVVVVRDHRRRRTIVLRAGQSYLAKAPARG